MKVFKVVAFGLLVLVCGSALIGSGVAPAAYNLIENSGSALTRRTTLNFVNGGCVDNAGSGRTDCTVLTSVPANAICPFTSATTVVCTHGLGTTAVNVTVFNNGTPPLEIFPSSVALTSINVVTVTFSTSQSGTVVVGGSSGSGTAQFYQTIQQGGTPLPQEPVLNFPTNMTCVDNPGNTSTDCTPSGGGGGSVPLTGWTVQNGTLPNANFNNFTASSVAFTQNTTSTVQWQIVTRAIPGTTYTVTATVNCLGPNIDVNSIVCGLWLFDGTKAESMEILQDNASAGVQLENRTLPGLSGPSGSIINGPTIGNTSTQFTFKVQDNGTNRVWSYYNAGAFTAFLTEASGSFLTPTAVGFGGLCQNGNNGTCTGQLLTWTATTP